MKPQLLKIQPGVDYSFSVRRDAAPYFYNRWHYHPEIELLHIIKGRGAQFIGDSIRQFTDGDMLLVGSNLPHYWRCDDSYFQPGSNLTAESIVAHFLPNFWSDQFINLPENKKIKELFEHCKRGLYVGKSARATVARILKKMLQGNATERILLLLEALLAIANAKDNIFLSSVNFDNLLKQSEKDAINKVYAYSLNNFKEKISLDMIASIANLSPNSFCRYFKTHTRKTYSRFLQELRVGQACKLLVEDKLTLTQICYESGFNNHTNFYKCFKAITNKTPCSYKKELAKFSDF